MKCEQGDIVGVYEGSGDAAVAKVLHVVRKPKRATEYVVKVDGEAGERTVREQDIISQEQALRYRKQRQEQILRTRVDELAMRLEAPSPGRESDPWLGRVLRTGAESLVSSMRGPFMFETGMITKPVVNGISASELQRVCAEADRAAVMERRVRYLSYLAAYVIETKGSLEDAREWIRVNHPTAQE